MGPATALSANDVAIRAFAQRLHDEGAEHVFLFGSHATGRAAPDSDYDLIVVNRAFEEIPRLKRHYGMHDLFYEVGGDAPLDLILLTPEEFEFAKSRITLVSAVLPEAIDLLAETTASA
jgi:predicted nucleotidyltransferase